MARRMRLSNSTLASLSAIGVGGGDVVPRCIGCSADDGEQARKTSTFSLYALSSPVVTEFVVVFERAPFAAQNLPPATGDGRSSLSKPLVASVSDTPSAPCMSSETSCAESGDKSSVSDATRLCDDGDSSSITETALLLLRPESARSTDESGDAKSDCACDCAVATFDIG